MAFGTLQRAMSSSSPRVAIIGGGFGGIATAVKLEQAGIPDFVIFEQSEGPGGTWWDNRYPGCEVDIPSHAYSYSFMRYDWRSTHASREELQQYAEDVIDKFGIRSRFRFSTKIDSATWDEAAGHYVVTTDAGEELVFDVVVSCVGLLSIPRYPDWPGLDDFGGVKFHSARWESEHDLTGKRVAIVGTGSTSAQLVPALAPVVDRLYVFQRQPGWVMPKGERPFTESERARFRRFPILQTLRRASMFYEGNRRFKAYDATSKAQQELKEICLTYIKESIDDPEVQKAVTPDYPWGCKRIVFSSTFYPALNHERVELVPRAVERVTETGIVDSDGVEREVDVIVLATGFEPTNFLGSFDIKGEGGVSIHEVWRGEPSAFLGITVPGFPNFFMLYGPNTNGGQSIIAQLERQAEVAVRAVRRVRRTGRPVDTRPRALERYVRWIDSQILKHASAMEAGCTNYYHASTGRNVTQWPRTHVAYFVATKILPYVGLVSRRAPRPVTAGVSERLDEQPSSPGVAP